MKNNPESNQLNSEYMDDLHERVQKARFNNMRSASSIYDLVYMNSSVSDVSVNRKTCIALLEQMEEWNFLPVRLKNAIVEDILLFMTEGTLPAYRAVWEKICEHPVYIRYRSGEMPAVSVQESIQESDAKQKRDSDIAQLRERTARETRFVQRLAHEYLSFDDDPTRPGKKPLAKTSKKTVTMLSEEPKVPEAAWDASGCHYSLYTSKKRA